MDIFLKMGILLKCSLSTSGMIYSGIPMLSCPKANPSQCACIKAWESTIPCWIPQLFPSRASEEAKVSGAQFQRNFQFKMKMKHIARH